MDRGVYEFLKNIYLTTGIGLMGSISCAYLMKNMFANPVLMLFFGVLFSFGGLFTTLAYKPKRRVRYDEEHEIIYTENSSARLIAYTIFLIGNSLLLNLAMAIYPVCPDVLLNAVIATFIVFVGSSIYAYSRPIGSLLFLRIPLFGILNGFAFMGIISIFIQMFFGMNEFTASWFTLDLYLGIVLFAVFIAYDTHKAIDDYKRGNADHLHYAIEFYLDFVNIFFRFLEIFGKREREKDIERQKN